MRRHCAVAHSWVLHEEFEDSEPFRSS
jgi:hypothetical protein